MSPAVLALVLTLVAVSVAGGIWGVRALLDRARASTLRDPLTRVHTREVALSRLEQCLTRARRFDRTVAVLIVGPERLERIDESLGHRAADGVLVHVARRLQDAVRDNDFVGRWDEGRFIVVLDEVGSVVDTIRVAERIIAFSREPVRVRGGRAGATVRVGVAISPSGGHELEELTSQAVTAFERASTRQGRPWTSSSSRAQAPPQRPSTSSSNGAQARSHLALEAHLRQAVAQEQFVLHYQPIVDLADRRILAAEALLRWEHPQRGLIGAGEFIEVAERSGLVVPIGRWVLQEASRAAARLSRAHGRLFPVSVNVSRQQLTDPGLLDDVASAVEEAAITGEHVIVELTEAALAQHTARAVEVSARLSAAGHRVAIDDFGTGFVSLAHLRRSSVSALKIDTSFVDGPGGVGDAIVEAIIGLSAALRLDVVAEGISDDAQHARLRQLGCTTGQGRLFGPPLSENDLTEILLHGGVAGPVVRVVAESHDRVPRPPPQSGDPEGNGRARPVADPAGLDENDPDVAREVGLD